MLVSLVALGAMMAVIEPDERTCFQTSEPYADWMNVRSRVAIVYGIGPDMPKRIETWRKKGYRIHVMTGVSWGDYQDYLYGRFDGKNHEDEAQTTKDGEPISHGGDVYYMSPGENYGKFLCVGVQRALDAGAEAIHLEEPEFWVRGGYEEAFKREYKAMFGSEWLPPHASCEAQWRASKLKYFLYRRALQQVFDYVQAYNRKTGKKVRCYVPTHSLLNYAQWRIVSPESSLAQLDGCDGYIAQVWTGTSRVPNVYRGVRQERTFESAFLEYGAMQNLVRATGRKVWYLNDPVEDDDSHTWGDYRQNWECTLVASLMQPEVDHYEVMPWPERVWNEEFSSDRDPSVKVKIPGDYATELQIVCRALGEMDKSPANWTCGTRGIGVAVADSMMFQRGGPSPSDPDLSHFFGQALPLVKRGIPVAPVQLENVGLPGYLKEVKVLVLSYVGQKPPSAKTHEDLVAWVKRGGRLLIVDDESDPFNAVPEWWNASPFHCASPVEELTSRFGLSQAGGPYGKGRVIQLQTNPASIAAGASAEDAYVAALRRLTGEIAETDHLVLRRGRYVVVAGLEESPCTSVQLKLKGPFVNLFDPKLPVLNTYKVSPGRRALLLDLKKSAGVGVLAAACHVSKEAGGKAALSCTVEGVAGTRGIVLMRVGFRPKSVILAGEAVGDFDYDSTHGLLWVRFDNTAQPRVLRIAG